VRPPLGSPALPRYYHHGTGLVEHITGGGLWHRDRARGRLRRRVKAAGGDPREIEYCAALGPGLLRGLEAL
jgi:hypothetical protein